MKISLLDIDEQGASFSYDQTEKELSNSFNDLLGGNHFSVNFTILRLGNAYSANGRFTSQVQDQCSLCGWELNLPIAFNINEILIEKDKYGRNDSTKPSATHIPDIDQPAVSYYEGGELDVSEFLHELIGVAIPMYPKCPDKKQCESQRSEGMSKLEKEPDLEKSSPFSVLKNWKQ